MAVAGDEKTADGMSPPQPTSHDHHSTPNTDEATHAATTADEPSHAATTADESIHAAISSVEPTHATTTTDEPTQATTTTDEPADTPHNTIGSTPEQPVNSVDPKSPLPNVTVATADENVAEEPIAPSQSNDSRPKPASDAQTDVPTEAAVAADDAESQSSSGNSKDNDTSLQPKSSSSRHQTDSAAPASRHSSIPRQTKHESSAQKLAADQVEEDDCCLIAAINLQVIAANDVMRLLSEDDATDSEADEEGDTDVEFHTLALIKGKYGFFIFEQQKPYVHHIVFNTALPVDGYKSLTLATRRKITSITLDKMKQQVEQYRLFLESQPRKKSKITQSKAKNKHKLPMDAVQRAQNYMQELQEAVDAITQYAQGNKSRLSK